MTQAQKGADDMWIAASAHQDRFLLPRRFKKGDAELDALYDAAQWLVDNGYATWMQGSSLAPGIVLTGKPWSN